MIKTLSVHKTKQLIGKQIEYALVDVREREEFSQEHQLLSCCIPYSRIEEYIEQLIPCKKIPIIFTDSGQNIFLRSERAARVASNLGYTDVYIQEGGLKAWKAEGYETFEGVNVLSKAFGELVAEECHTPLTKPEELDAMVKSGKKVKILDVRPYTEFNNMCIPKGVNTPGSEVLYRLADLISDDDTHVLVNCAGRTRGIIAAQSLINAQVPNTVSALKGGTMGWELANLKLEYGQERYTPFPSQTSIDIACERAAKVASTVGVKYVDHDTVQQWQSEASDKTLYILDVRQQQEFEKSHYPGAKHSEGGQLVQATDEYAAVRCARYVITDDTNARANTAASWLTQMGYPNVYVLKNAAPYFDISSDQVIANKNVTKQLIDNIISIKELSQQYIHNDVLIIDVGSSDTYSKGHIPNSVWVPRSRISLIRNLKRKLKTIVIVSDDLVHAQHTLFEAKLMWPELNVLMLNTVREKWGEKGYPIATGIESALCDIDDIWYKPYEDTNAKIEDMQGYFDWEYGLVEKIKRDGDAHFYIANK